ncbi:MAG: helix-turn-helix transcriptional regulator, partial [Merdibacter sp.]|nr:helix-turn-helix transcriptional regulator [Merdibacter sp.]
MDSKKIGAFIAEKRKKKGLTQEQLGAKLGVSNKTISRWENGNYMPDLSLLEPLSKELEISLNELLSGEDIEKEKVIEYSEQNLLSTIDYTDKKIKDEHKKISLVVIGAGIVLCIFAFTVFPSESSWGEIYSVLGLVLTIAGVFRELKKISLLKRGLVSICLFLMILGIFFFADYIGVTQFK